MSDFNEFMASFDQLVGGGGASSVVDGQGAIPSDEAAALSEVAKLSKASAESGGESEAGTQMTQMSTLNVPSGGAIQASVGGTGAIPVPPTLQEAAGGAAPQPSAGGPPPTPPATTLSVGESGGAAATEAGTPSQPLAPPQRATAPAAPSAPPATPPQASAPAVSPPDPASAPPKLEDNTTVAPRASTSQAAEWRYYDNPLEGVPPEEVTPELLDLAENTAELEARMQRQALAAELVRQARNEGVVGENATEEETTAALSSPGWSPSVLGGIISRSLRERGSELMATAFEGLAAVSESDPLGTTVIGGGDGAEEGAEDPLTETVQAGLAEYFRLWADRMRGYAEEMQAGQDEAGVPGGAEYYERATNALDDPLGTLGWFLGNVPKTLAASAGEIAVLATTPGAIWQGVSRAREMAEARAENDDRDAPTVSDYLVSAPYAAVETLLGRIAVDKAIGGVAGAAGSIGERARRVGTAAIAEAGQEAAQTSGEIIATQAGTEMGVDAGEAGREIAGAAIAGGLAGGALRTGAEGVAAAGQAAGGREAEEPIQTPPREAATTEELADEDVQRLLGTLPDPKIDPDSEGADVDRQTYERRMSTVGRVLKRHPYMVPTSDQPSSPLEGVDFTPKRDLDDSEWIAFLRSATGGPREYQPTGVSYEGRGNQGTLRLRYRDGERTVGGQDLTPESLDQTPRWFQEWARKWVRARNQRRTRDRQDARDEALEDAPAPLPDNVAADMETQLDGSTVDTPEVPPAAPVETQPVAEDAVPVVEAEPVEAAPAAEPVEEIPAAKPLDVKNPRKAKAPKKQGKAKAPKKQGKAKTAAPAEPERAPGRTGVYVSRPETRQRAGVEEDGWVPLERTAALADEIANDKTLSPSNKRDLLGNLASGYNDEIRRMGGEGVGSRDGWRQIKRKIESVTQALQGGVETEAALEPATEAEPAAAAEPATATEPAPRPRKRLKLRRPDQARNVERDRIMREEPVRRALRDASDKLTRVSSLAGVDGSASDTDQALAIRETLQKREAAYNAKVKKQSESKRAGPLRKQRREAQPEAEELARIRNRRMGPEGMSDLVSAMSEAVYDPNPDFRRIAGAARRARPGLERNLPRVAEALDGVLASRTAGEFGRSLGNLSNALDDEIEARGGEIETTYDPDALIASEGQNIVADERSRFRTDKGLDRTLSEAMESGRIAREERDEARLKLQLDNPASTKLPGDLGKWNREYDAIRQQRKRDREEAAEERSAPLRERRAAAFEAFASELETADPNAQRLRSLEGQPRRVVAQAADELGVQYPKRATRDGIVMRIAEAAPPQVSTSPTYLPSYEEAFVDRWMERYGRGSAERRKNVREAAVVQERTGRQVSDTAQLADRADEEAANRVDYEDVLRREGLGDLDETARGVEEDGEAETETERDARQGLGIESRFESVDVDLNTLSSDDVLFSRRPPESRRPAFRGLEGDNDFARLVERTRPAVTPIARDGMDAALRKLGGRQPRVVVDPELRQRYGDTSVDGAYVPAEDTIYLAPDAPADTLAHEAIHAASHGELTDPQSEVGRDVKAMHDFVLDIVDGLPANLDEFVAEARTKARVQRLLDGIPYAPNVGMEPLSVWQHFVRAVRRVLGLPNTPRSNSALQYLMERFERMPARVPDLDTVLFSKGEPPRLPPARTGEQARLRRRATDAFDSSMGALSRILAFSINPHNRNDLYGPRLFTDPDTGVNTHERIQIVEDEKGRSINVTAKENHEFVNRIARFVFENNAAGEKLVNAIQLARNFNVDPLRRPEQQELNEVDYEKWKRAYDAYSKLSVEAQRLFAETRNKFKAMSDRNVRLVVRALADAYSADIAPEKTVAFGEAVSRANDREIAELREAFVNENDGVPLIAEIADGLIDLAKRSRLNFYVPNMRFGDKKFHLRARGKLEEPMSKKEVQKLLAENPILNASRVTPVKTDDGEKRFTVELVAEVYGHAENDADLRRQEESWRGVFDEYVRRYGLSFEEDRVGGVEKFEGDVSGAGFRLLEAMRRKVDNGEIDTGAYNAFQTTLFQLMPQNSMYSSRLRSRDVAGASDDFIRVLSQAMRADAYYKASLEHDYRLNRAFRDAYKVAAHWEKKRDLQKAYTTRAILDKWRQNHADLGQARDGMGERIGQFTTSLAYLNYLWSVGYSVVNAVHTFMSAAYMSGELGSVPMTRETIKALGAIMKPTMGAAASSGLGARQLAMRKPYRENAFNQIEDVVRTALSAYVNDPDYDDIMNEQFEVGLAGRGQAIDVVSNAAPEVREGAMARTMDAARFLPHIAELVARAGSSAAVYKAAKQKGMSKRKARELVMRNLRQVQVDYSGTAEPLWVPRSGSARAIAMNLLLFKKFAGAMTTLMARTAGNMAGLANYRPGARPDPEVRRRGRAALKSAAGMAGMLWVLSGTQGMLVEPVRAALGLLQLAINDPDEFDEPLDDPDAWINELAFEFGRDLGMGQGAETFARVLTQGLLSGTDFGIDISSRVGFQQLLLPSFYGADTQSQITNALLSVTPVAGMFGDLMSAVQLIREGQPVEVLLQAAAPAKWVRDAADAYGIAAHGRTFDRRGREVFDLNVMGSPSATDAIWRAAGLDSATIGEYKARLRDMRERRARDQSRRRNLLRRLNVAFDRLIRENDGTYLASVANEIHTYNMLYPDFEIDAGRSLQNNIRRRKGQVVGMPGISPKEFAKYGGPDALQKLQR